MSQRVQQLEREWRAAIDEVTECDITGEYESTLAATIKRDEAYAKLKDALRAVDTPEEIKS